MFNGLAVVSLGLCLLLAYNFAGGFVAHERLLHTPPRPIRPVHTPDPPLFDSWGEFCLAAVCGVVITSVLPIAWLFVRLFVRPKSLADVCAQCSYNLTGNVSGVCPECGTAIAKKL
jgi:hypothetical protein